MIEARLGRPLKVQRIYLRNESRSRANVPAELVTDDPAEVYAANDIDIVVELIGGVGVAGKMVEAALSAKKPVVTANKALLAERAQELIAIARKSEVDLYYEGAVGGGIPVKVSVTVVVISIILAIASPFLVDLISSIEKLLPRLAVGEKYAKDIGHDWVVLKPSPE